MTAHDPLTAVLRELDQIHAALERLETRLEKLDERLRNHKYVVPASVVTAVAGVVTSWLTRHQ
jgi:hypothetical protein